SEAGRTTLQRSRTSQHRTDRDRPLSPASPSTASHQERLSQNRQQQAACPSGELSKIIQRSLSRLTVVLDLIERSEPFAVVGHSSSSPIDAAAINDQANTSTST